MWLSLQYAATGLLGNTDNSWWKDLVSPTDQTNANSSFIDNNLSALYTGSWTKQQFGSSLSSYWEWPNCYSDVLFDNPFYTDTWYTCSCWEIKCGWASNMHWLQCFIMSHYTNRLVSDSSIGLICRFKVAISGGTSATGLLGNTDNSWWKDLVSPTDQTNANSSFIDNNLSADNPFYTDTWYTCSCWEIKCGWAFNMHWLQCFIMSHYTNSLSNLVHPCHLFIHGILTDNKIYQRQDTYLIWRHKQ
jgi:hypothetical protein